MILSMALFKTSLHLHYFLSTLSLYMSYLSVVLLQFEGHFDTENFANVICDTFVLHYAKKMWMLFKVLFLNASWFCYLFIMEKLIWNTMFEQDKNDQNSFNSSPSTKPSAINAINHPWLNPSWSIPLRSLNWALRVDLNLQLRLLVLSDWTLVC